MIHHARASQYFRLGYSDRMAGKDQPQGVRLIPGSFAHADYIEGWSAADAVMRAAERNAARRAA